MVAFVCCSQCGRGFPAGGLPYLCPVCGGLFEISKPVDLDFSRVDRSQPGIWKYRHTFGLPASVPAISLGEGNTPLVWVDVNDRKIAFKCEFLNPSGSFKDRGSSVIVAWLKSRAINNAIEDSSGNAGASFAAYSARAGVAARVFVPESASGPKRKQIAAYGAELITVSGSRSNVSKTARDMADQGVAYASHAYLPFNIPGYATAAYEIYQQLGMQFPASVVVPIGQGGLLLGLAYGFHLLRIATNQPNTNPIIIGVQAAACAPITTLSKNGQKAMDAVSENLTLAEGVRVRYPIRAAQVVEAVTARQGVFFSVEEDQILPARDDLARLGLYVEPTSAIVWLALNNLMRNLPDPIVVILTGSGYKYV